MRGIFEKAIAESSRMQKLSEEEYKALEDVDAACEELAISEFESYVQESTNRPISLK